MPKSEFAKFNGNCNQTGQICLFLSDPAIPDVNLYGWSVMYVEDGLIAMQPGDSMPSVQEKIIGLADRRWEFTGGRGGFITKPKFNAQNPDGTYGPPGGRPLSSAYFMAVALVNTMLFNSGQASMGPGDIPESGPILTATPYNVVWENAHIPTTLNDLLVRCGYTFVLKGSGVYKTCQPRDGRFADGHRSLHRRRDARDSLRSRVSPGAAPDVVVITSGRRRASWVTPTRGPNRIKRKMALSSSASTGTARSARSTSWTGWAAKRRSNGPAIMYRRRTVIRWPRSASTPFGP